jgi:hypothetical protein
LLASIAAELAAIAQIASQRAGLAVFIPAAGAGRPCAEGTSVAISGVAAAALPPDQVAGAVIHLHAASVAVEIGDAHRGVPSRRLFRLSIGVKLRHVIYLVPRHHWIVRLGVAAVTLLGFAADFPAGFR